MTMPLKVLLLVEREVGDTHPGRSLRVETLRAALQVDPNIRLTELTLCKGVQGQSGVRRIRSVLRAGMRPESFKGHDAVVVAALGSPHMTWLGGRIARHNDLVTIDLCDSQWAWLKTYAKTRSFRGAVVSLATLLALFTVPKSGIVSYISNSDLRGDRRFRRRTQRTVVEFPRVREGELMNIDPFEGPASRIVVPADLNSPHNRIAFEWLKDLYTRGHADLPSVEVFGPMPASPELPHHMTFMGWAPRLADVYAGQTVVFAPNLAGGGLQNKVCESISAGRPVVVGRDAAGDLAANPWVHTYDDQVSMLVALQKAVTLSLDSQMPRELGLTRTHPDLLTVLRSPKRPYPAKAKRRSRLDRIGRRRRDA